MLVKNQYVASNQLRKKILEFIKVVELIACPEMINALRVNILVFQRQMHFFISWLSPWNCIIAVIKAQWLP